jgi:hypothetical protein
MAIANHCIPSDTPRVRNERAEDLAKSSDSPNENTTLSEEMLATRAEVQRLNDDVLQLAGQLHPILMEDRAGTNEPPTSAQVLCGLSSHPASPAMYDVRGLRYDINKIRQMILQLQERVAL